MRLQLLFLFFAAFIMLGTEAHAEPLPVPNPSPAVKISQYIGGNMQNNDEDGGGEGGAEGTTQSPGRFH